MKTMPRDINKRLRSRSAQIDRRFKENLRHELFKEDTMATNNQSLLRRGLSYVRAAPALAVLAVLVLVGTSSALVATTQTNNARNAEIEVPANLDGLLSFNQIKAIASAAAPDSTIRGIELEKEDGVMVYKVKFSDDTVRIYDAVTGKSVAKKAEIERDKTVPSSFTTGITAAEARVIALEQRPGKAVVKIELETENGVVVYSVRFSDDGRVDVNAANGNVMRVRGAEHSDSVEREDTTESKSDDDDSRSDSSGKGSGRDDDSSDSGSSHGSDD